MTPRNVATISEYTTYSECVPIPPATGRYHCAPVSAGRLVTWGTIAPRGKVSRVPASTRCRPPCRTRLPANRRPSTTPSATITRVSTASISTPVLISTVVRSAKTGGVADGGTGAPAERQASTRNTAGMAIAASLSQNWNAWTMVTLRIPPAITFTTTTTATSAAPAHGGAPVTV